MSIQAPARQEFVILTHVRSGSSLLADLLARNGIGNAKEHLNQRVLVKADRDWDLEFIHGPLAEEPRRVGAPLRSPYAGHWRARRGEYRVRYIIDDDVKTVTVLDIDHRRDAYHR
jgi:mRNA-degrading endonuclease RelE of RelBE toxin-antitoxin system